MGKKIVLGNVVALAAGLAVAWCLAGEKPKPEAKPPAAAEKPPAKPAPAVQPKPLSEQVKRGLKWLAERQLPKGAWGQGEESAEMGGGSQMKDQPSVADTSMAALTLIRAGNAPTKGEYAKNVLRAAEFICGQIEAADMNSLYITPTRGTRVQTKLGPYIDTFAAAVFLPEVKDRMPDAAGNKRVAAALDKLLGKIQKNQQADGTWGGQGWATTLQQNMAVTALNGAVRNGIAIDEKVREKTESQARKSFDRKSGKFSAEGSAGVELYTTGANYSGVTQNAATNALQEAEVRKQAASAPTKVARDEAKQKLARFDEVKRDQADAERAVIARLDDKQFIAGFGSNGGEEFLSYMNIAEGLVLKGGDAWKTWDKSITENVNRVQNGDGSWSGHHCITGRTFCTSAALLVLMADRSPLPVSEKLKRR